LSAYRQGVWGDGRAGQLHAPAARPSAGAGVAGVTDQEVAELRAHGYTDREIADVVGVVALNVLTGASTSSWASNPHHHLDQHRRRGGARLVDG